MKPPATDPTRRFSSRVEDYVRSRPHYPPAILPFLSQRIGLTTHWTIADIGSGTGISSQLFLDNGNTVFAVEPNADMRAAAERLLARHARFHSIDGTAESTGLPDASVDLVAAMQAFHWFDPSAAAPEFRRILKPAGSVLLAWNDRRHDTPFLADYESLLREHGTDYQRVRHENLTDGQLRTFFGSAGFQRHTLPNEQQLDYPALEGRVMSSSYVPAPGAPGHAALIDALRRLFARHEQHGRVTIAYDTHIYFGRLS